MEHTASQTTKTYFIIDFDSTFTRVEALDELCNISLASAPDKEAVLGQIEALTNQAMEGKIPFRESLEKRLALLKAHKGHLALLTETLKNKISESFLRNKSFFQENKENIWIISSGFKDIIVPVVADFGIPEKQIFANTFEFDANGAITGFDRNNPLSADNGKVKVIQSLGLKGEVIVIGDGNNDYEIKKAGLASEFYAFTENVERASVMENADHVAPSLDEFLFVRNLPMAISYPKNRIKVLLLENIHPRAYDKFKAEGYEVETIETALNEDELIEKIKDVSILGIRSKTEVTKKVLENAGRLRIIGAYCIGTNQIDTETATEMGVCVFNAPYSNTRSVVELAIGQIIMLMRNIPDRIGEMHKGIWKKTADKSNEIRGKKLGIVGYGSIGSQLSVLAELLGMEVYFYDYIEKLALGNAKKCETLEELLEIADVVSMHVDGRTENTHIIGRAEFDRMKQGVIFLNLSRGFVVEIDALAENLKNGKIRGAAVDVFPYEPKSNKEEFVSELRGLPNLILTPHIGGSTEEAQIDIAGFVPNKIIEYMNTGNTLDSVNFPNIKLPKLKNSHRLLHLHLNTAGVLAQINSTLAKYGANITGQYLKTNEQIGYVITDIDKNYDKDVIADLKQIENTIKFRVLY